MTKKVPAESPIEGHASLYLFFGDEFLVKERVHEIVSHILNDKLRETNLIVLDGNSLELSDLFSLVFTPSLFGGPHVIVVDQTTIFMGRTDQKKLAGKVVEAWKAGERKTALRAVGQLVSLAGVDRDEVRSGLDWINDVIGDAVPPEDREAIWLASKALVDEGGAFTSSANETLVMELVQSSFPQGTVLIFTALAVDKKKKVFKVLEQRGNVVECSIREEKYGSGLDRSFFDSRVRDTLALAGKKISKEALDRMYAVSGKELRKLHSELDKLVAYLGDRQQAGAQDVELLFIDSHQGAFFDLTNAIRTADLAKCFPALHYNLRIVAHPLQTLAAIATEFRRLIVARELLFTVFRSSWKRGMSYDGFSSALKKVRENTPKSDKSAKFDLLSMKDYPLYLYLRDAQKFTMEKLVSIMEEVLDADIMMKSSSLGYYSPQTILENLILTICSPRCNERLNRSKDQRQRISVDKPRSSF